MKRIILILFVLSSFSSFAQNVKDFNLPIYGKEKKFNLAKEAKKYKKVLINFWASWCTSCIQEMPELEALKSKYEKQGVLFIAVNAGEKKKKIQKFLKKHKFSYLILEDQDRKVSKSLNVTELPRTFVIDKSLKVHFSGDRPPKAIDL